MRFPLPLHFDVWLFWAMLFPFAVAAQGTEKGIPTTMLRNNNNLLVAGPMLGYVEHREVLLWLDVAPEVKTVEIAYFPKSKPTQRQVKSTIEGKLGNRYNPIKVMIDGLEMNTEYGYEVVLNGKKMTPPFPLAFKTKELWEWRKDAPDFSFQLGSCVYLNDSIYDRPGKPYGQNPIILEKMAEQKVDFMVWLGDNLYLREADYSSPSGIAYRYNYNFRQPQLQKLRATRANYATWDDHDYGANDSDSKYELKEYTYEAFKRYFGNKTFGETDNVGVYHKFKWSDAQFLMLDDRYYRSSNSLPAMIDGKPNPNKTFLGKKQLEWLKNSLITSDATFKFIVCGGQVSNSGGDKEGMTQFPAEWQDLMSFIVENKISGIVILSGDRHFSELLKSTPQGNTYPLYEFTCSPLTSGVKNISKNPEANNPLRVTGTLLMENNFGKISVTGTQQNRQLRLETYDQNGILKWSQVIKANDLIAK